MMDKRRFPDMNISSHELKRERESTAIDIQRPVPWFRGIHSSLLSPDPYRTLYSLSYSVHSCVLLLRFLQNKS